MYLCEDLEKVELLAPSLVSLRYRGDRRKICLKDSPQLASLMLLELDGPDNITGLTSMGGRYLVFNQFISYLPKLESLTFTANCLEGRTDLEELPVFSTVDVYSMHLTQLGYYAAASIMKLSPKLEQLEINQAAVYDDEEDELTLGSMPLHQNLKELKLTGYRGYLVVVAFLTYVVKHAGSLDKISLTPLEAIRMNFNYELLPGIGWRAHEAELNKKVLHWLREMLPENVELLYNSE